MKKPSIMPYGAPKFKSKSPPRRKKYDILVIRVTSSGDIRNSRPCAHCIFTLQSLDGLINRIYYSQDDGTITYEKMSEMHLKPGHISAYNRYMISRKKID